jgi:ATP-dependent RNA helicase DOB1
MTFDERNKDEDDPAAGLKDFLAKPFYKLQEVARTVVKVEIACGVDVNILQLCCVFDNFAVIII